MRRIPERELMDLPAEVDAYAAADFSKVNQAFVQRLVELAGHLQTAEALDLGTGPGDIPVRLLRTLRQGRPGARWTVTAVDASAGMLACARRLVEREGLMGHDARDMQDGPAGSRIHLVQADAKQLPFADASFDVVFSNSILHHINDAASFWGEVRRVARPGAIIFLRDLALPGSAEDARRMVQLHAGGESALLHEEFYRSLLAAYTVDEVAQQLRAAGLEGLAAAMVTDRHMDVTGRR